MSLQINKGLRKTALLLVIAGMILGLVSPSACDEFYNNLLKLNGHTFEIRSVSSSPVTDCITSGEASGYNPYRLVVRRSGNSRPDIFRLSGSGSSGVPGAIPIDHLSILFFVSVLCTAALAYYHIIFIHLKDGHK